MSTTITRMFRAVRPSRRAENQHRVTPIARPHGVGRDLSSRPTPSLAEGRQYGANASSSGQWQATVDQTFGRRPSSRRLRKSRVRSFMMYGSRRATNCIGTMADDIPFNRTLDLAPGVVEEVAPGVRRILVDNPSPFTFKGTLSYIVGRGKVADHRSRARRSRAHRCAARRGARRDGDPYRRHPHPSRPFAGRGRGQGGDRRGHLWRGPAPAGAAAAHRRNQAARCRRRYRFRAGPAHRPWRGLEGDGWALEAIATPGHTANHMAFALQGTDVLFSGDHVMGWSTSIVAPPDGAMSDYMASLHRLARAPGDVYLAGHGDVIRDAPRFVAPLHPAPPRPRGIDPASPRARARPTSRRWCGRSISGSIPGSPVRPASRPSPISRTWWRAGSSRPTARRRSLGRYRLAALIGLLVGSGFAGCLATLAGRSGLSGWRGRRCRPAGLRTRAALAPKSV